MFRWLKFRWRAPDLTRLFVGQHIVNGVSVGVGVIAVALAASAIFGFEAGQPATLGAISASISDMPAPWREKARAMGFGFALALIATAAIQLALPWPPAALLTIGAIAFAGGMVTGLGRWAIAVGMQAVIPMVFVLGFPRETFATAVRIEALFAAGGLAYIAFALLATIVTDASARRLVASESIREFSIYLRAVAAVFDPGNRPGGGLWRGDPPAGGVGGTIAVGARAAARPCPARIRKPPPRRHHRHSARRFRRAHRRAMRRRARSRRSSGCFAARAHRRGDAGWRA